MKCLGYVLVLVLTYSASAAAAEVVQILYHERPPFHSTAPDGSVIGFLVGPTEAVFRRANVQFRWKLVPAKRELLEITENNSLTCLTGFYVTPERQAVAKFSKPIYWNKPEVALVGQKVAEHAMLNAATLMASQAILVMKDGYSYGSELDGLISNREKVLIHAVTHENIGIARMVKELGNAFMFVPGEEAQQLTSEGLTVVNLPDLIETKSRHLMCTKKTSDEIMSRLNQAIQDLSIQMIK